MRFALVVPALNEEQAIAGTLRRCLAARQHIVANTKVDEMVVVFVNDGSTDRTQEIVDQPEFDEVVKVNYGRNRGYGAAIKAGWQATDCELLGFIDGDGTCEPQFCVDLLNKMFEANADVVLAARLNPDSQMPLIRKIGNFFFARLLGVVSGKSLTDTASGFRIVKRSSLKLMSPLPDGLHFTPAMSCICLLDPRLNIQEVHGMLYKEREGRSKLSVIKDGFRFLYTILFSACCYSPIKTMLGASAIAVVMCTLLAWITSLLTGSLAPVYGFAYAAALLVLVLFTTGIICHQLNFLLIGPRAHVGPAEKLLQYLLDYKRLIGVGTLVTAIGGLGLIAAGLVGDAHPLVWMAAQGVTLVGAMAALGGMIVRVIWAVGEKQHSLIKDEYQLDLRYIKGGSEKSVAEKNKKSAGGVSPGPAIIT